MKRSKDNNIQSVKFEGKRGNISHVTVTYKTGYQRNFLKFIEAPATVYNFVITSKKIITTANGDEIFY